MANFAIMGFGTVGGGVAEVLRMNREAIEKRLGEPLCLKYILDVRDLSASPYADKVVGDFSVLENDPDLDVVVESIGGAKVALDFTRRALLAGKHVVTSNKELVATHGRELLAIAREKNVNYLFEASVGGGIPLLRPIFQCLAGNEIEEISGILNGTTNFILTRMFQEGVTFDAALREAQERGYAEQDPTADVEGLDAGRKICILADRWKGRTGHQAGGPGGAQCRRLCLRLRAAPPAERGAPPGGGERRLQRGDGPGQRRGGRDVLRPGRRGPAHRLRGDGGHPGRPGPPRQAPGPGLERGCGHPSLPPPAQGRDRTARPPLTKGT